MPYSLVTTFNTATNQLTQTLHNYWQPL